MRFRPRIQRRVWFGASALVAITTLVLVVITGAGSRQPADDRGVAAGEAARSTYYCPMHPTYQSNRPGDCPICNMRLVPAEAASRTELVDGRMQIHISPRKQQLIGVQTDSLRVQELRSTLRAAARVEYDESAVAEVNAKVSGWIERLHVATTGQHVQQGQPLLEIYSPELVSAQEEYLLALRARQDLAAASDTGAAANATALAASARRRLQLWDVTNAQIDALERSGQVRKTIALMAPSSGYAIEKSALLGKRIVPGETLFRIADLSQVWIVADVHESDVQRVRVGVSARIELGSLPGRTFSGRVSYIYPYVLGDTRTAQLRIDAPNPGLELKPGMYADVVLESSLGLHLVVPKAAVLDSGPRQLVFVDQGNGYFDPREVVLGQSGDNGFEVRSGVRAGEKVVVSANFLIDSESLLRASVSGMSHQH